MLMSNVKHSAAKYLKLLCPSRKQPAALCCNFPCTLVPPGLCQNCIRTQNPFKPWLPAPSAQSGFGSAKTFHLTSIHQPNSTQATPSPSPTHPRTPSHRYFLRWTPQESVRSLSNCWRRSTRQRRTWRFLTFLDLLGGCE